MIILRALINNLTSRFSGSINSDFHTFGVDSEDGRGAGDENGQVETLAPATSTNESEIIELGHIVLHDGSVVTKLTTEVLIISSSESDHSAISDLTQCYHLTTSMSR